MVGRVDIQAPEFATSLIRDAAQATGADFDFLLATAARESNFDTGAEARTSSAAGMFQFIEQTWLGMMERHGQSHGYGALAQSIERDANGRYNVEDPRLREEILNLRFDAEASARMAGELASENAAVIEARTGRPATGGELYAAHFLGANGAASLIEAAADNPGQRADHLFPAAAAANRAIFYESGRPRSAADVLANLTGQNTPGIQGLRLVDEPGPGIGARSVSAPMPVNPGSFQPGGGELSPVLVEILASLEAPGSDRDRKA